MTQKSHWRIAKNMGFVAVFLFLAKVAGAAKEIVVAHRFGVTEVVDAYLLVFTLLMWLPMVWTVVLATVYVPISKRLDEMEAVAFTKELAGLTVSMGVILAAITAVVLPPLVPVFWGNFTVVGQQQLQAMLVGLSPMVIGVFLASLYSAQLLGMEKHSNSLFEGIPSLMLAVIILFATSLTSVNQFVFGSLIGVGLQVAALGIVLRKYRGLTSIKLGFSAGAWRVFRNAIGIMIVSQLVMGLVSPVDLFYASQLGQGNIAIYGYAQRILLLGMGLGATAVARAILPVLSDESAVGTDSRGLVFGWACTLWGIGCLGALLGWFLSIPVVSILFERGAFTAQDTQQVAAALRFGLFQLPWYFSGVVLVQYFASRERYNVLFQSSLVALAIKVLSVGELSRLLGIEGIMLSSSLMYFASWTYLVVALWRSRSFVTGSD